MRKLTQEHNQMTWWAIVTILFIGSLTFIYFVSWNRIPGEILLWAKEEQSVEFNMPATGTIYIENDGEEKNALPVMSGNKMAAVKVDLSKKVTLQPTKRASYKMDVKLLGIIPFKQISIQVVEDIQLYPVGTPVGIFVKTNGILVVETGSFTGADGIIYEPSKYLLEKGDYITNLNGVDITGKKQFMEFIKKNKEKDAQLTVWRNGERFQVVISPKQTVNLDYKLGIWVRDNAQGIGTITFLDDEGNFGALGHGINDSDTGELMVLSKGSIYQTNIINILKGEQGTPGELTGTISYQDENILGDIWTNSKHGVFGSANDSLWNYASKDPMPIALKQEIKLGPAQIYTRVQDQVQTYDIQITEIHLERDNINKGLTIQVTDDELLDLTGGIVQGMSGAPIIQNGKLIGAVTHVLVGDPTRGYGIFVENMLEE